MSLVTLIFFFNLNLLKKSCLAYQTTYCRFWTIRSVPYTHTLFTYIYIHYSSPRMMDSMVHHLDHLPRPPICLNPSPPARSSTPTRGSFLAMRQLHRHVPVLVISLLLQTLQRTLSHSSCISYIPSYSFNHSRQYYVILESRHNHSSTDNVKSFQ